MYEDLLNLIRKDEGFRASAYRDARRDLTIDCARWIDARLRGDITSHESEFVLAGGIKPVEATVRALYNGADGLTALDITRWRQWRLNLGAKACGCSPICLLRLPKMIGNGRQTGHKTRSGRSRSLCEREIARA